MHGARVFSTLDACKGFYQIGVRESDREKLAFTCQFGLFQFKKLPFGISTAPGIFQELMTKVLSGAKHAKCFIDDILVLSRSFEEHLIHLADVFERLDKAGLKLKMSKCSFFQTQVKYLGNVISADGILPDPDKSHPLR